jgi:outer membrane biosynthesis protein TonB
VRPRSFVNNDMKAISLLALLILLLSSAPSSAAAQERDRDERGVVPNLMRLLNDEDTVTAEVEEDQPQDQDKSVEPQVEQREAPATPTPQTTSPATPAQPSTPTTQPPPPQQTVPPSPTESSTTTAVVAPSTTALNTHSGGNSGIYATGGPLSRTESGILFMLSMGLVFAGLSLAERDSLRRLFKLLPDPAPLPERTALP